MCLQCTHIHTFTYFSLPYNNKLLLLLLLLFPSLQNIHGMMNGRIVCGDVIVRISGDQGKKVESLVIHVLLYMYIHEHCRK